MWLSLLMLLVYFSNKGLIYGRLLLLFFLRLRLFFQVVFRQVAEASATVGCPTFNTQHLYGATCWTKYSCGGLSHKPETNTVLRNANDAGIQMNTTKCRCTIQDSGAPPRLLELIAINSPPWVFVTASVWSWSMDSSSTSEILSWGIQNGSWPCLLAPELRPHRQTVTSTFLELL